MLPAPAVSCTRDHTAEAQRPAGSCSRCSLFSAFWESLKSFARGDLNLTCTLLWHDCCLLRVRRIGNGADGVLLSGGCK